MTFAQKLGKLKLSIHSLPENYTGKLTVTYEFHNGTLKEMNHVNTQSRVDIQKLNDKFGDSEFKGDAFDEW